MVGGNGDGEGKGWEVGGDSHALRERRSWILSAADIAAGWGEKLVGELSWEGIMFDFRDLVLDLVSFLIFSLVQLSILHLEPCPYITSSSA